MKRQRRNLTIFLQFCDWNSAFDIPHFQALSVASCDDFSNGEKLHLMAAMKEAVDKIRPLEQQVTQNTNGLSSAIDGRTARHDGYAASLRCRARIEEIFGWLKRSALSGRLDIEARSWWAGCST